MRGLAHDERPTTHRQLRGRDYYGEDNSVLRTGQLPQARAVDSAATTRQGYRFLRDAKENCLTWEQDANDAASCFRDERAVDSVYAALAKSAQASMETNSAIWLIESVPRAAQGKRGLHS
jgi:hypothetical protein